METFTTVTAIREYLQQCRKAGKSIGFVPTMGTLHEGHLSLIEQSKKENEITVCSIFVNPIQFNNPLDLAQYPRNLVADEKFLIAAGCDVVFAPPVEEMYPGGKQEDLNLDFDYLEKVLEARFRPGHFNGVAIVVKRLFDIVEPARAYFGKKDYQQLLIVKQLVIDLKLPIEIIACPIVREADGLAMSSRNLRLTIGEREDASQISDVLMSMKEKSGAIPLKDLKQWGIRKLQFNPLFRVDYLEVVDKRTLHPLENWKNKEYGIICTAVFVGDVRLIDNLELFS